MKRIAVLVAVLIASLPGAADAAAPYQPPNLTLSPTSGPTGTSVSAIGHGLGKRVFGTVRFGTTQVASFRTNPRGKFTASFSVPSGYSGLTTVTAFTSAAAASASFDVTTTSAGTLPESGVNVGPLTFADEFDGTSLIGSVWASEGYHTNGVVTHTSNVSVSGGNAILTLASSSSGAEICTCYDEGYGPGLPVGGYTEARIRFPGNGTSIYNWPTWWASGPNWPASGEHDIAEALGGRLTVNYHSPSLNHNTGAPAGYWGDQFHTYGLHRKASSADVYWDGRLVRSYPTSDNGNPESLIVNVGTGSGGPNITGPESQVLVDYVRMWTP
jgi:hypothetical protein